MESRAGTDSLLSAVSFVPTFGPLPNHSTFANNKVELLRGQYYMELVSVGIYQRQPQPDLSATDSRTCSSATEGALGRTSTAGSADRGSNGDDVQQSSFPSRRS